MVEGSAEEDGVVSGAHEQRPDLTHPQANLLVASSMVARTRCRNLETNTQTHTFFSFDRLILFKTDIHMFTYVQTYIYILVFFVIVNLWYIHYFLFLNSIISILLICFN